MKLYYILFGQLVKDRERRSPVGDGQWVVSYQQSEIDGHEWAVHSHWWAMDGRLG